MLMVCSVLFWCHDAFPAEAEAEEPAAEADHGPTAEPHLGDQLHAGRPQLNTPIQSR